MSSSDTPKVIPEMNVSVDLFNAWQKLRRRGDPQKMAKQFGLCRAPFDNALNYGNAPKYETVGFVNQFFKERLESEKQSLEGFGVLDQSQEQTQS